MGSSFGEYGRSPAADVPGSIQLANRLLITSCRLRDARTAHKEALDDVSKYFLTKLKPTRWHKARWKAQDTCERLRDAWKVLTGKVRL